MSQDIFRRLGSQVFKYRGNESIQFDSFLLSSLLIFLTVLFGLSLIMFVNEAQSVNFRVFFDLFILLSLISFHPLITFLKSRFDYFETINIYLFMCLLSILLPSIILFLNPDAGVMQKFWSRWYFEKGLILVNMSLLALYMGYYLPIPTFIRNLKLNLRREYSPNRAKIAVYLLSTIYLLCLYLLIEVSGGVNDFINNLLYFRGIMYYGYGILQIGLGVSFWFLLFAYVYFFSTLSFNQLISKHKMLLLISPFILGMLILSFSRGALLGWVFMILVFRNYFIKKISLKNIILFFIIFLTVATFLGAFRGIYDIDIFANKPKGEIFWDNYLSTFGDMESFLVVLTNIPQTYDFFGGRSMLEDAFFPLLPRIVWPGKSRVYGPMRLWESIAGIFSSGSFFAVSMPGYFYMDFGIIGIFFGFLIFGFSLRIIYQIFLNSRESRGVVLIYALLIALLQGIIKGGFPTYLFFQYVLPVILVTTWVHGKPVKKYLVAQH